MHACGPDSVWSGRGEARRGRGLAPGKEGEEDRGEEGVFEYLPPEEGGSPRTGPPGG